MNPATTARLQRFDQVVPIGCTGLFFCLLWLCADAAVPMTMLVLLGCGIIRDKVTHAERA